MNLKVSLNGIDVFYKQQHDGGGTKFHGAFCDFLRKENASTHFPVCMEFCSGPGFIGFSLLGAGIIDRLCLVDINSSVRGSVENTIAFNGLGDKVQFHCSDALDNLPASLQKSFDLIVSNPPHIDVLSPDTPPIPYKDSPIIYSDPNFNIHRRFLGRAGSFLKRGGRFLFIENSHFSSFDLICGDQEFDGLTISQSHCELPGKYWLLGTCED